MPPTANAHHVVGIADMKIAKGVGEVVTHALGSCIGLAIWDPETRVGGILHFMLPESKLNPARAQENPLMFADTGVPRLFKAAYKLGAEKRRIIVKIAGGANVLDPNNYFNIGKRNTLAAKKILYANSVLIRGELVGGSESKTMRLNLEDGSVSVRSGGGKETVL